MALAQAVNGHNGAVDRHGWARGADNRHARKDLGWTPSRQWREGLAAG